MPTTTKKSPKRKTRQRVHIGLLLDESYSMNPNRSSVVTSVNQFVDNLAEEAEDKDMRATLAMFDAHDEQILRVKYEAEPFKVCRPLTMDDYVPRGGTPLNDAVLQTIELMEKKARKRDKVMLVVMTDGYENSSHASADDVHSKITKKEADGWAFIYLGANQDAWAEGTSRGFAAHSSTSFTSSPTGTSSAIQTTSNRAAFYAGSDSGTYLQASQNMSKATGGQLAEGVVHDLADYAEEKDKEDEDEDE